MKTIQISRTDPVSRIKDIASGECFRFEADAADCIWIRLINEPNEENSIVRCVNLCDGSLNFFSVHDQATPVDAALHWCDK